MTPTAAAQEKPGDAQRRVILRDVRISYPHIFEPYAVTPGAEAKYSAAFLVPKANVAAIADLKRVIQSALTQGIATKWGQRKPSNLRMPLRDGDERDPETGSFVRASAEYRGHMWFNASAKRKPGVVFGPHRDPALPEHVYPGQFVNVSINSFPYSVSGNVGIALGINNVWLLGHGERIDGGISAEDEFANLNFNYGDAANTDDLLGEIA